MAILNFTKKQKESESELTEDQSKVENNSENIQVIERPKICCFDLDEQTIDQLKKSGANIFEGTLGSKIKVPNTQRNTEHRILINYSYPTNLHEFDIVIIDLQNSNTIDWKGTDHTRESITGKSSVFFLSSYPETLFDPRPISSYFLNSELKKIKRQFLVIVFSTQDYKVEYDTVTVTNDYHYNRGDSFTESIYSFWNNVPLSEKLCGKEVITAELGNTSLTSLLNKYKNEIIYHQTFYHPTNWIENKQVKDDNFVPLMTNLHGEIISFAKLSDNGSLFIFPQIKDKTNFLLNFLSDVAPSIFPKIFPFSSTFKWKEEKDYWLPNHSKLLARKDEIQRDFKNQILEIDSKINENHSKFLFLHELITEFDDLLVKSVIEFLKWLGFENVRFVDEEKSNSKIKEEDIQVDLQNGGLLVIECKGIGGTSTDSDCSQISKIKHRRSKERKSFDVFALYVVNHQRFLPPLVRTNPPFTKHQIQDAENDERGLLSTWQLFNLFFDIENGIVTKEEARESILEFGLVDFKPKNLQFVDKPNEVFKDGTVCIVNIGNDVILMTNEILFVEKNGKFHLAKIIEIQKNDQQETSATDGEFGLKLDTPIRKNSTFWKKVIQN